MGNTGFCTSDACTPQDYGEAEECKLLSLSTVTVCLQPLDETPKLVLQLLNVAHFSAAVLLEPNNLAPSEGAATPNRRLTHGLTGNPRDGVNYALPSAFAKLRGGLRH